MGFTCFWDPSVGNLVKYIYRNKRMSTVELNKSCLFKTKLEFYVFEMGQMPSSAFIQLHNFGLHLAILEVRVRLKNVLDSTHEIEQLLFATFP